MARRPRRRRPGHRLRLLGAEPARRGAQRRHPRWRRPHRPGHGPSRCQRRDRGGGRYSPGAVRNHLGGPARRRRAGERAPGHGRREGGRSHRRRGAARHRHRRPAPRHRRHRGRAARPLRRARRTAAPRRRPTARGRGAGYGLIEDGVAASPSGRRVPPPGRRREVGNSVSGPGHRGHQRGVTCRTRSSRSPTSTVSRRWPDGVARAAGRAARALRWRWSPAGCGGRPSAR